MRLAAACVEDDIRPVRVDALLPQLAFHTLDVLPRRAAYPVQAA